MEYRALGKTGMKTSVVALGAEGLEHKSESELRALVDASMALGVNLIDLFNPSPYTRSNLGAVLRSRRERVLLQGHIGTAWLNEQYNRVREIEVCRRSFDDLLTRLHTDYIDIAMLHYVDEDADFDAVMGGPMMEYARALKKSGVIRSVGMSCHRPETALRAAQSGEIDVLMFSINPAYDMKPPEATLDELYDDHGYDDLSLSNIDPLRERLYRACEERGVGITVMKPFAAGVLLDPKESPFGTALTPVQCIHYCLTRPAVASVICGCGTAEEMAQCAAWCEASERERDYATALAGAPQHAFSGHCMYCGHCAPCPVSIDVAAVNKFLDMAVHQDPIEPTVRDHYLALGAHGSDCVGCGACEGNCPFGVPVRERMAKAAEVFGK